MSERERHYSRCGFGLLAVVALCATLAGVGQAQDDNITDISSSAASTARGGVEVTPNDTLATFLSSNSGFEVTRGLYVGGAGDVTVVMKLGQEVTFADVPAGVTLPIRVSQVMSTGTTATDIVALW